MEKKDYLQDIRDIKKMMSQSTQFISLSGLSGILAGIYALAGACLAADLLPQSRPDYTRATDFNPNEIIIKLFLIAVCVIVLSIITGIIMSSAKAKKHGEKLWNATSQRLFINFCIPLISGGIFCLLLISKGIYGIVAPAMLLFYGMACINSSKFTFRDVRYLGVTLILLGLFCTYFTGYGLYFWAIGFGLCHILYGSVMYFKYDRK